MFATGLYHTILYPRIIRILETQAPCAMRGDNLLRSGVYPNAIENKYQNSNEAIEIIRKNKANSRGN